MAKFKQTDIGEIPVDWSVKSLSEIADVIDPYPSHRAPEIQKDGFPYLGSGDFDEDGRIVNVSRYVGEAAIIEQEAIFSIEKGDLAIGRVGTVGKIIKLKSGQRYAVSPTMAIIKPKIESDYLVQALRSEYFQKQLGENTLGSTRPAVGIMVVRKMLVAQPQEGERSRIGSALSCVDTAIAQTNHIIEQARQVKRGLTQELLTRGIGHKKFKQTEIGEIPEEWDVVELGTVADDFITGGTPSTSVPEYWAGNIYWTRSASITKRLVEKGERFISDKGVKNSATAIVPKDNVLIATRVSIGNIGINTIDIAISQDLTGIVLNKDKVTEGYLYWALLFSHHRIASLAQGSTIQGLSLKDLKKFTIPMPKKIEEQKYIDQIITTSDDKIEAEIKKRSQLEQLKKGLMQDLLTGKVRFPEFAK